jgi:hypothetical protein
MNNLL